MPIYKFKCQLCGTELEALVKAGQQTYNCPCCEIIVKDGETELGRAPSVMTLVPSVPSPMQWGCSRGF